MPKSQKDTEPLSVFLDSNIFISAILSQKGGSYRLFHEARLNNIKIFSSFFVVREVMEVVERKYPSKLEKLKELFVSTSINLIKNPPEKEIQKFIKFLDDFEDAPVIADAKFSKSDFLITLDRKHFFTPKIKNAKLSFQITNPRDFFQKYWIK